MRNALLLLCIAFVSPAFSQVAFQNISFSDGLSKAKAEGKLVFLQVASPSCRECNAVAEKGLSDKELSNLVNQTFVALYVGPRSNDRRQVEAAYNLPDGFGTLFIDGNGTLIHRYAGSSTRPQPYKEAIDLALYRAGESLKVSELEKEYRNGNKTPGFLEQLLLKKKSLNLDNTGLLDEYVSLLPADSLSSAYTLQFIASMMPVLHSKADAALRKDSVWFNQAWLALPSGRRAAINSGIIYNSLNKAIREKNERYAFQVASFARSTHPGRSVSGIKAAMVQLLEFYKRTEDTAKYLTTASGYYDLVVKTTNTDSLKKADSALQAKMLSAAKRDTMKTTYGFRVSATVVQRPLAQRYTWELKEAAWNVYKRTADPALLAKATSWIEKGLALLETHEALDVYARLLYKQHQNEPAITAEKKAVDLKKKIGFAVTDYEATLTQMQNGLPLAD